MIQSFTLILLLAFTSFAGVIGTWQTIDDETGEVKSHVEIYQGSDQKLYGKIVQLIKPKKPDPVCTECSGELQGAPILNLVIINGLTLKDGKYQGGTILDPKNGKEYDCEIWEERGVLKVRGYLGFFYRTQEWRRL